MVVLLIAPHPPPLLCAPTSDPIIFPWGNIYSHESELYCTTVYCTVCVNEHLHQNKTEIELYPFIFLLSGESKLEKNNKLITLQISSQHNECLALNIMTFISCV